MSQPATPGATIVSLISADPSPPDRGNNTFALRFQDAAGQPVSTATIAVRPWMPDHGHGATPELYPLRRVGPGQGEVGPINFFMPGLWEVQVRVVEPGSTETSRATFSFCVEG